MKCQILFSRKNKKKYFKMSSAEIFSQHAKCYTSFTLSKSPPLILVQGKNTDMFGSCKVIYQPYQ